VNTPGVQKPLEDYQGRWDEITPETVADFSAVGYFFGKELHQRLDVPIGLIDNAWGGSSCEAWVRRDHFSDNELYKPLMERWAETEAKPENAEPYAKFEADLFDTWQAEWIAAKKNGTDVRDLPNPPAWPRGPMVNQHRPGNLYNGRIKPIMPFAVKGVIWYQGESNAGRAYQYRELFPLMIQNWREDWGQGNFSFYWVQLADFMDEQPDPVQSSWAELREAQTMTMDKLPHTGEAVIIDIGEASDIHPRNKEEVGRRLARWAMAEDYSLDVAHQSPRFREMSVEGNKAILKFDHIGTGLRTVDAKTAQGFAIAGEDQNFVWATAEVKGDTIEVSAEGVAVPVAVRYAWADNPVCNIYSQQGLPLTPFRTDDWAGVTADAR
ncbi:MAG: sialate O-acetylesterase, partial [Planctomycetales bacterium]|nr:sialate O-acetylesterase [Planctomycetales bacterium]